MILWKIWIFFGILHVGRKCFLVREDNTLSVKDTANVDIPDFGPRFQQVRHSSGHLWQIRPKPAFTKVLFTSLLYYTKTCFFNLFVISNVVVIFCAFKVVSLFWLTDKAVSGSSTDGVQGSNPWHAKQACCPEVKRWSWYKHGLQRTKVYHLSPQRAHVSWLDCSADWGKSTVSNM